MSLTLGTNIASLRATRTLQQSGNALQQVFERLSSGQRINRASDDAAGLAIGEQLKADVRVYNQGVRNLNDGISYLNIMDAAISELKSVASRIQELATQSANGVYEQSQRAVLNEEVGLLVEEYNRILGSTDFNDINVLAEENNSLDLQVGYDRLSLEFAEVSVPTGEFTESVYGPLISNDVENTASGDFNGDGILDIASVSGGGSFPDTVQIAYGNGDGSFQSIVTVPTYSTWVLETYDVDGDGDLDFVTDGDGDDVGVILNDGSGNFSAPQSYATGITLISSFAFGDLTGDGSVDILTAGITSDSIQILTGNGDGTFSAGTVLSVQEEPGDVAISDLNGDGNLDITVANEHSGFQSFSVFLGDGTGSFSSETTYTVSPNFASSAVETVDVNNDGILDIVGAGGAMTNNVAILLGNGDGTFGSASLFSGGEGRSLGGSFTNRTNDSLRVSDLDQDGNVDIVITGESGEVSISFGNGDGTFQSRVTYASGTDGGSIEIGDFNGDGANDIVAIAAQPLPANVQVFLQDLEENGLVRQLVGVDVSTQSAARTALSTVETRLEELSSLAGTIGANQARVEIATNVLQSSALNQEAAAARILDVDMARETAELVRLSIIQQASAAVLAQANLQPSLALELLT